MNPINHPNSNQSSIKAFPFRHIENRFLPLHILSAILTLVAIHYALITLSGFILIIYCCIFSVVVGIPVWHGVHRYFSNVIPHIIQAKKRIAILCLSITFGIAAISSAIVLVLNYYIPIGASRHVDAKVLNFVRPGYRQGWAADFQIEGKIYYQKIRVSNANILSSSRILKLELQRGLLGFEHIVSISSNPSQDSRES